MSTQEPQLDENQLRQASAKRVAALGKALGLHKDFVSDVQARGQAAIIDRADGMDRSGALGRVLSVTQRLASFMQEGAEALEPPMQQGAMLEAIADLADRHDMDKLTAVRLVGTVLEVYDRAAQQITRGNNGKSEAEDGLSASAAG